MGEIRSTLAVYKVYIRRLVVNKKYIQLFTVLIHYNALQYYATLTSCISINYCLQNVYISTETAEIATVLLVITTICIIPFVLVKVPMVAASFSAEFRYPPTCWNSRPPSLNLRLSCLKSKPPSWWSKPPAKKRICGREWNLILGLRPRYRQGRSRFRFQEGGFDFLVIGLYFNRAVSNSSR
jgi:hypothetical protein